MTKSKITHKKRVKPRIQRSESWRYIRVSESWRRPTGKSSRMRKKRRGWALSPAIGYGTHRKYKGLHPSRLKEIIIHNVNELENFSPDEKAVRIAANVGEKKRISIIEYAQQLGYKILNPKTSKTSEEEPLPSPELESKAEQVDDQIDGENSTGESEKSEKVEED